MHLTRLSLVAIFLLGCITIVECYNNELPVFREKMSKKQSSSLNRRQQHLRSGALSHLNMKARKSRSWLTERSSSSEGNDTSIESSNSSEENTFNETSSSSEESKSHKKSKTRRSKTRRGWSQFEQVRNVLRPLLREESEEISYTRPIPSDTCGRQERTPTFSGRIIGGFEAKAHSWPWQVLYEEGGTCGGTLINAHFVLTAAHCIGTEDPSLITITAGIHNRNLGDEDETGRQKRQAEKVFVHPDWDSNSITNDIALVRLAQPVDFNEYVQPACLPGPDPEPDSEVVLIGWGAVETGGGAHHILKQTQVHVVDNCEQYWSDINNKKQICVRDPALTSGVCNGDSGGPMLQEHSGQWVVEGVTSFGHRECEMVNHDMPNVYTRVSAYLPWINGIIHE